MSGPVTLTTYGLSDSCTMAYIITWQTRAHLRGELDELREDKRGVLLLLGVAREERLATNAHARTDALRTRSMTARCMHAP